MSKRLSEELQKLKAGLRLANMSAEEVLAMDPYGSTHNIYCTLRQWQLIQLAINIAVLGLEATAD